MAAKASRDDYTGATVYVVRDAWKRLKDVANAADVSASAIGAALIERFVADQINDRDAVLARAAVITAGRRRRAEG